ncbi:uncharacterized protein LOC111130722 isoform X2 [Crassostrea virginica]
MMDENGNIVRFFVLPSASKQPRFRRRWIEALPREIFHPNRSEFWHAVCSRHLTDGEPTDAHPVLTLFGYNNYGKSQGKPRTSNNSRASASQRTDSDSGGKITDSMSLENGIVVEPILVADLYQGVQHEIVINLKLRKKRKLQSEFHAA